MIRTDERLVNSLCRLEGDTDYQILKEWVRNSFGSQLVDNIDARDEDATRGQGYAEALRDIMAIIEDPRKLAEKFKK